MISILGNKQYAIWVKYVYIYIRKRQICIYVYVCVCVYIWKLQNGQMLKYTPEWLSMGVAGGEVCCEWNRNEVRTEP